MYINLENLGLYINTCSTVADTLAYSHDLSAGRNLVPRAFPLKKWVGPTQFLRERPWGRGCAGRCNLKSHFKIIDKKVLPL